ncbi:MAG: histidine phosphatase family protein [bacterium]|nr:histidine phosphatase family protein [bacterium]
MKIFLIRHGEQRYPYNEQGKKLVCGVDASLVDLGRQQMRELRQELDRQIITLDAVYRSPLLRAEQSADELVGEHTIPIYVVDELKEGFPNSGEGHTYEELEAIGGDIYAYPFSPDQETLNHLVQRSRAAIEIMLSDAQKRVQIHRYCWSWGSSMCIRLGFET